MDFGKSFKFYRQKAGLTQKEAAEKIGVKDYQLANYETNRSQPSLDILKKMSKVYLVSIDKMLGNNLSANKRVKETKEEDYVDTDELLANLNEIVEKINKANNK
jgi:transcriptional regulator with XRE-family HTH domain